MYLLLYSSISKYCLNWSNFCYSLLRLPRTFSLYASISLFNYRYARIEYCMQGWAWTIVLMAMKINQNKEVKLKRQENEEEKNLFLKEMVLLMLKRMIPMMLLYLMTMLTKLICIFAVTFSV